MASNSTIKTISLCIFLFLASALVTLTLKSTHHTPSSLLYPTHAKNTPAHPPANAPKLAYATFLAGNAGQDPDDPSVDDNIDGYYLGARVLAYQLLHSRTAGPQNASSTRIPFLVVCTTDVSARKRARLHADGATVILVDKLAADWVTPGAARWRDVLAKLRLFQLVEYHKICFIDADTLVTAPLEGVFYDAATLTQATAGDPAQLRDDEAPLPRTYMFATHGDFWGYEHPFPPAPDLSYLNCGFFVFAPSLPLFDYYMSLLQVPGKFDPGFPEQNLLNYAHRRDGNMPWKLLWYGWNVNWPTERDWRGGARSFHAKYWDGDPSHDPVLKAMWREQRSEMEGFWRGREWEVELKG